MKTCTATDPRIDLSEAEALLELPVPIPVRPAGPDAPLVSDSAQATFIYDPASFGIVYSLENCERFRCDPNESLLHELVHVRQWFDDPLGFPARVDRELDEYGYLNAPHEVEARELARMMLEAGVRVYFPETTLVRS